MKRLQLVASWPEDFFSKCVREMPSEFKDSNTSKLRGYYHDLAEMEVKRVPSTTGITVFDFQLREGTSPKPGWLSDLLRDIRHVAKIHRMREVQVSAADLTEETYKLMHTGKSIQVVVRE